MKVHCPYCQTAIGLEYINLQANVAVCDQCGELTSLSSLSEADVPVQDAIPPSFNVDNPPGGAWFDGTPDRFIVGATTRSVPGFLVMVPFTIVWAGGSMAGFYGTQFATGQFSAPLSLVGLPFAAGSAVLVTMCLMTFAGKVVVSVDSGQGTVFTGVAGVGMTRRFQWQEVDTVIADIDYSNRARGQNAIALEGATRIKFGTTLSEARRHYILNTLRTMIANRSQ